jgi:hypothetical protein
MCIQHYPNHFIAIPSFDIAGAFDAIAIKDDRRVCDIIVALAPKKRRYVVAIVVDQNTSTATLTNLIEESGIRTGTLQIKRAGSECATSIYVAAYCCATFSNSDPALRPLEARADFAHQVRNGNLRLPHN